MGACYSWEKILSVANFLDFNFGQKFLTKSRISLQRTMLPCQGSGHGTCMILVLFCCALRLNFGCLDRGNVLHSFISGFRVTL